MPATTATDLARAPNGATMAALEAAIAAGSAPSMRARGLVPRARLVARLLEPTYAPLVLVVAPAGFGKTTLLAEWAESDPRPFAFVRPDPDQNGPSLVDALRRAVADHECPTVVAVDDAHLIDDDALGELATLLDHLPVGSQLAIASRSEPRLPIGRLRAHRRVVELRSADLAMTRTESAALLATARLNLEPSQVDTLVRRTEGWPAGLYLAAVALREQSNTAKAVAGWTGEDRLVADYIRDELLSGLSPAALSFLLRTSVLDRLSGPLCDAVLDQRGSAATLTALSHSNLLLVTLDRRDEWYRYHPLLAATLKGELRRREPDLMRGLNQRASEWHVEHGDPDAAIKHAVAARDRGRAGHLLWQKATRYAARGQNEVLRRWLESFSVDEIADEPALALVAAATDLARGDGNQLRHWASAAGRGLTEAAHDCRSAGLEAGLQVMLAASEDELDVMRGRAADAYGLAPADSPLRAVCRLFQGVADQLTGEHERARDALEEGASRGATAAPAIGPLCLAQLALIALDEDDLGQAEAIAGRAMTQVERFELGDYPPQAIVFAVSAAVRSARGRVEDASRDLRRAQRLLARLADFTPWFEAEVRLVLARAAFRLSDVPTGRGLIAETAPFIRRVPDSPVLRRWLAEARAQADAVSAAPVSGGWVLTTAELRVLQFLPSHLSFPEIADRLCVSPNTIKTHARAVYRKLDATSRAEAVVQARQSGLLDTASGP